MIAEGGKKDMPRRGAFAVRIFLAAVSVTGLAFAAGVVVWSALSRPTDAYLMGEAARSFDLQASRVPAAVLSVARPPAPRGMAVAGHKPAPGSAAAPARDLPARVVRKARASRLFMNLLAKPAPFLMAQTSLRSAREMRAFLADRGRVDAYMNSPLVRVALNSATFTKAVLGNGRLVRAFLASPALQDPVVVRELLRSPLMRKMLDCPGIQQALADPNTIAGLISEPETARFMAEHPQALQAIASAVDAHADSTTGRVRLRR
ncbi:MAG: hypothetical protein AAB262_03585 [Elusimicrobiota bacterium]